ncbi:hypothetical protein L9F63_009324 [Diploptera punctata]|uniref:F-box domain-containing protein n=1 Tax=Diploptera punctata TaxID=6984 RepID=A0AAD8AJU4_DIPPU|nr:hypothetical protein L9F63_009324 [Diploptera punctata]
MLKATWKVDENDEAIFIDAEEETDDESCATYSNWSYLPDLILEKIFSYLSIRERYYASMVCRRGTVHFICHTCGQRFLWTILLLRGENLIITTGGSMCWTTCAHRCVLQMWEGIFENLCLDQ